MDDRTEASAAFALRLVADLYSALVLTGVLTKPAASALLRDALAAVLQDYPAHAPALREIAGVLTAQVGLAGIDLERQMKRE
jgi:hypothetical protein